MRETQIYGSSAPSPVAISGAGSDPSAAAAPNTQLPLQAARSAEGWGPLCTSADAGTPRDAAFAAAGGQHRAGMG